MLEEFKTHFDVTQGWEDELKLTELVEAGNVAFISKHRTMKSQVILLPQRASQVHKRLISFEEEARASSQLAAISDAYVLAPSNRYLNE